MNWRDLYCTAGRIITLSMPTMSRQTAITKLCTLNIKVTNSSSVVALWREARTVWFCFLFVCRWRELKSHNFTILWLHFFSFRVFCCCYCCCCCCLFVVWFLYLLSVTSFPCNGFLFPLFSHEHEFSVYRPMIVFFSGWWNSTFL